MQRQQQEHQRQQQEQQRRQQELQRQQQQHAAAQPQPVRQVAMQQPDAQGGAGNPPQYRA
ncbi:hypothetical protein ACU4HD_38940 [Cupriavidus basilensis]|nr:hypothetical protein [Cupriavidus basilensis]MDF3881275.1 hypothetical protein [Cupriavidus basilensis]